MKTYIDKYGREWTKIGRDFVKGYPKESVKVTLLSKKVKLK